MSDPGSPTVAVPSNASPTAAGATSGVGLDLHSVRRLTDRAFDVADPADASTRGIALIIWGAWTALVAVLLITHDPWRDELQAWALSRASAMPWDVISNLRHEGHPPSWYLLLWPVTKIVPSIVGLQVVTFVVGSTAAFITLRKMPVSLFLRTAIVFSYFPLFEFGTISRSYSFAWLLTVTALWLANRPGTSNWWLAIVLAALAGTTVLTIPLAVAIAFGVWGGPWFASRVRGPLNLPWLALFTVVPTAIAAIALPAAGGGPSVTMSKLSLTSIGNSFASVLRAAFPVMDRQDSFWGRFVVRDWSTWGPLLGLLIVVAIAWSVRRSRTALTVWTISTLGYLVILAITRVPMSPRLVSPLWEGAIAAVWFAAVDRRSRSAGDRRPVPILTKLGVAFLLGASLWASAWAVWVGTAIPFTSAAAAADWIEQQADGKDVVILCAINAPMCSSVAIRLDAPAYMTANGQPFAFVDWKKGWGKTLPADQIPAAATKLAQRTGAEVFIVAPTGGYPAGCQNGQPPPPRGVTEWVLVCRADQVGASK